MVGRRIKELRKERNLTQQQFAALFNLNDSTISLYENEKREPEFHTLLKIADSFNVTVDWLLGRTDNKNIAIVENEYIPKDLLGVEYLKLAKEMHDTNIPPEDIRKIIAAIKALEDK
ncbi:MAG: helix-turn-helix transcriptional regulator [Clostridiaceae bacterium]|nr:helix-turn-helix transcriptional regulator [Clostridiaceae bacterium]